MTLNQRSGKSTPSFKDASSTRQPIPTGSSLLRLSTAFLFVVPATVSRAILYCNTIFVGAAIDLPLPLASLPSLSILRLARCRSIRRSNVSLPTGALTCFFLLRRISVFRCVHILSLGSDVYIAHFGVRSTHLSRTPSPYGYSLTAT